MVSSDIIISGRTMWHNTYCVFQGASLIPKYKNKPEIALKQ